MRLVTSPSGDRTPSASTVSRSLEQARTQRDTTCLPESTRPSVEASGEAFLCGFSTAYRAQASGSDSWICKIPHSNMNGSDSIKKAAINKAKQVASVASSNGSSNGSKKRQKKGLAPIITTEGQQEAAGGHPYR